MKKTVTLIFAASTLFLAGCCTTSHVHSGDQMIYDIEVCEIHKTKMEHKEVRIAYGLLMPGPDAPSGDTERGLFPHRHEVSFGGCVTTPDSPKTERVYVCSECKKAYDRWTIEHKKTK